MNMNTRPKSADLYRFLTPLSALLLAGMFWASCSGLLSESTGAAGCPCSEGYQCVEQGRCAALCSGPSECEDGEMCVAGVCLESETNATYTFPATPEPLKIDMLWVVDNSTGMCGVQRVLPRSFELLAKRLEARGAVDLRLAVTTTYAVGNHGKFVNTPATVFPPSCTEREQAACLGDTDCEQEFGPGWTCNSYPADQMYNFNGSINSSCTFRCDGDSECCAEFCTDECGADQSCIKTTCEDAPFEECTYTCRNPGDESISGCSRPPNTEDCPDNLPTTLTMGNIDLFKCLATVAPKQTAFASVEQGLKAAWFALNPEGPNSNQSEGFLRPDAYLMLVFVTDEEDCSVDEDFCAPNALCEYSSGEDKCAKDGGTCKLDVAYSYIRGEETRLCCGTIKKDYFDVCGLLGEYKGYDHHVLSYDLTKTDCQIDEDCEEGWYCKESSGKKKCRPYYFSFPHIADYFNPPGAPIFSMTAVTAFHSRFKSLKEDASKVLVATITPDGLVVADDQQSLISLKCLGEAGSDGDKALAAKLDKCVAYKEARAANKAGCVEQPDKAGCEVFYETKLDCIRQCYVASKGNAKNVQTARNSYVCQSATGDGEYASRYVKLAQMFGPNGLATNLCGDATLETNLSDIADLLERRTMRFCLPRAPEEWETVSITVLTPDGDQQEELLQGPGAGFTLQPNFSDCCAPDPQTLECTGSSVGVFLNGAVESAAQFKVEYTVVL